jgi:hypothetical protein
VLPVSNTNTQVGGAAAGSAGEVEKSANPYWRTAWHFAVHACVGTLIFGVLAVPAVLLNWSVDWLEAVHKTDLVIILGLRFAEYAIFGSDLLLIGVFLFKTLKRTIREL